MNNLGRLFCLITLTTSVFAFQNCKITPHTLLELVLNRNPEPLVLSSSVWESWAEVPCQYYYNKNFYSLVNVINAANPAMINSTSTEDPNTKLYYLFCQHLASSPDFAKLECNTTHFGNYYALSVYDDGINQPVCTGLSSNYTSSISNDTMTVPETD